MLVIIHGWSDTYESFLALGNQLVARNIATDVTHIRLGDYVTLDDDVTFDDIVAALDAAWKKEQLPVAPGSVDVVVHSTGGLVIRHWLTTFHSPDSNPVKHLLMLAPANFGSPLAHKGRSYIGRVVKGFKSDKPFQTGTHILKGLELASPYSWQLALKDRFSGAPWYGPGRMLCTVLVGDSGYTGIAALANEAGSDGTVRLSTANLNPLLIRMDFSRDPQHPAIVIKDSAKLCGSTAFARLQGINHGTITMQEDTPESRKVLGMICMALTVDDAGFPKWIADLDKISMKARDASADDAYRQGYQNSVVCLKDDFGSLVADYMVELFAKKGDGTGPDDDLTAALQEDVITTTHVYGDCHAYRSLLINTTELIQQFTAAGHPIHISVSARPDIRETGTVGYATFGYDDIGSIRLTPEEQGVIFKPDRTVLIDIIIRREQTDRVFRFRPL